MFEEYLTSQGLTLMPREKRFAYPRACERERWLALDSGTRAELERRGDEALKGYPMRPATAFLAFTRTGDRQADEQPYFERRQKLINSALAECARYDGRYIDAVIDGIWCICEETSWVISAHNGSSHEGARPAREHPLPNADNPYIDLFSAQTAATLAWVAYLLKDRLDEITPIICRRVYKELEDRVIKPFLTRDDFWWMGFIRRDLNNWTPWIVSNVLDVLLLAPIDEALASEGVKRALRMLDRYLAVLPSDGGCDEGVAYWNMAGGSLLDCLESLRSATGGKADFYDNPLVRAIGDFPCKSHISGEWYWNFADCDAKPMLDGERLYTYGVRTGNDALIALGASIAERKTVPNVDSQMKRLLDSLFCHIESRKLTEDKERTVLLPALQAYAFERNGLYAAIKGGNNAESHNHNDIGTFILYLDGEPTVVDAGNMVYTAKTFGDERYTLWNTRSRNHNIPLVRGCEQIEGKQACAENITVGENGASMSLKAAYPEEAELDEYTRELINNGELTIRDYLRLNREGDAEWVFLMRNKPQSTVAGELLCGRLTMRYDSRLAVGIEDYPVTDERMAHNFPGSLWRVTLKAQPSLEHRQSFIFARAKKG